MKRLLAALGVFLVIFLSYAAPGQATQMVDKFEVSEKWLALAVEDVETAAELEQVLRVCEFNNASVTLFTSGSILAKNQQAFRKATERGHEFGNHGMKHRRWSGVSQGEIKQELSEAAAILRQIMGRGSDLFLPPFGYYDVTYLSVVEQAAPQGLIIKGIDLTEEPSTVKESILAKAHTAASNGAIFRLNYKMRQAVEALPLLLEQWRKQGYAVKTISELKTKVAIVSETKPQTETKPQPKPQPKPVFHGVLHRISVQKPMVALTFDDGGSRYKVKRILDALQTNRVQGTFFLLGEWVIDNQDLVQRMFAEGHEVANHSYSHPRFTWLSEEDMTGEIIGAQTAIVEAVGQMPSAYFRPPYGSYNSSVVSLVKELGYQAVVMWDIDTRDWSGRDSEVMARHVLDHVHPGAIILFHLHGTHTPDALEELIPALQSKGYILSTIGQMLAE